MAQQALLQQHVDTLVMLAAAAAAHSMVVVSAAAVHAVVAMVAMHAATAVVDWVLRPGARHRCSRLHSRADRKVVSGHRCRFGNDEASELSVSG